MAIFTDAAVDVRLHVLATFVFFVDLFDMAIRLYLRWQTTPPRCGSHVAATSVPIETGTLNAHDAREQLHPYAIVVSVHNAAAQLARFLDALAPFRDRLWIVDDGSTDDTWDRLTGAGVHCMRGGQNRGKPGALRALIDRLPPDVDTVVIVDPDSRILVSPPELETALFEFQRSGMAALCPHITIGRGGWLTSLQLLEYAFTFSLGRKSLGDTTITSGIAIYRRDAIVRVLERHSLSIYAEDLENTLLLLAEHERVYYDGRVTLETDGKTTAASLFSQRVGWHFGLLKVYAERWRLIPAQLSRGFACAYQFFVYTVVFGLLCHPLKVAGIALLVMSALNLADNISGAALIADTSATSPVHCLAFYVTYCAMTVAAIPLAVTADERLRAYAIAPLYPFYALSLVLPATVGYANWFTLRLWGRRVYRDHYQPASL